VRFDNRRSRAHCGSGGVDGTNSTGVRKAGELGRFLIAEHLFHDIAYALRAPLAPRRSAIDFKRLDAPHFPAGQRAQGYLIGRT
jgi:hypothetical protein